MEKVILMLKMDMEYSKGILFVRLDGFLNRKTTYKINKYLLAILLDNKIKYLVYNLLQVLMKME